MLKKEIRILGLAVANAMHEQWLVGTIFRGNSWLDGILTCSFNSHEDYVSEIARTILKSKQYSQIRAIVSRESLLPKDVQDLRTLSLKTHIPTISIVKSKIHNRSIKHKAAQPSTRPTNNVRIERGRYEVTIRTLGLHAKVARDIFLIGCRIPSLIPEALRIAELITIGLENSL